MKVKLNQALTYLRLNRKELSEDVNMSRAAISHFTTGKLKPSDISVLKIEFILNEYRTAEIDRLLKRVEFLKNLEWDL